MSFPRLATSIEPFPRMVMTFENFAGHAFGNTENKYATFSPTTIPEDYATFSPTPFSPRHNGATFSPTPFSPRHNGATFSPTPPLLSTTFSPTTKEEKSDYDYDETSMYNLFRDRLEELKVGWPLTEKDEDDIISKDKNKYPDKEDFDTLLIKMAFIKGNETQKSLMITLADKLNYTL